MNARNIQRRYLASMVCLAMLFSALAPALSRLMITGSKAASLNALICSSKPIDGLLVRARANSSGSPASVTVVTDGQAVALASESPVTSGSASPGDCPYCQLTAARAAACPPTYVVGLLSHLRQQAPSSFDDGQPSNTTSLRPHARGPPHLT